MKKGLGLMVFLTAALMIAGCGGSGSSSDQSSSLAFDMAVLEDGRELHIEGTVFNDLNGDGLMDAGEMGIPGVTVDLVDLATTVTDSLGYYSFDVAPGEYIVLETNPVGLISTTPDKVEVIVSEADVTVNFGDKDKVVVYDYAIFGTVFDDQNANGVMDTGESGIPGVMVSVEGVSDVMTASDGYYAVAISTAGTYKVVETDPAGYISTTPNEVFVDVVDMDVQVDFGDMFNDEIPVDVKPGSTINPLNLRSKGVLPVAIIGSETFDVTQIDPATLLLNGVPPLRWSYEDVCGSDDDDDMDDGDDDGDDVTIHSFDGDDGDDGDDGEMPDGYVDMTLKFSTPEIAAQIIAEYGDVRRGDIVTLTMTGALLDGSLVSGEETVWIVQVPKN